MSNEGVYYLNDASKESDFTEVLTQLDSLGGLVEDSAERIKRLVERADNFIQRLGPKLGVEAEANVGHPSGVSETYNRLIIARWDKGPASDNADGKWHIIFQTWGPGTFGGSSTCRYVYDDEPSYCQSLPSAKLENGVKALPILPDLLRNYFATAKEQLDNLIAVQTQLDKLEREIGDHLALEGL